MFNKGVTIERCPHCEQEVELKAVERLLQVCPNCGRLIYPCSLCNMDKTICWNCNRA